MTSYCKICDIHINDLARHIQTQTHTKIQKSYERGYIDGTEEYEMIGRDYLVEKGLEDLVLGMDVVIETDVDGD